jgi:hypothetical protein
MPRISLLLIALFVAAPLAAAEIVTPEIALQPRLMPDPYTNCSVHADEPRAYAVCATPFYGPQVRIDLDVDGRPLLETRRPYMPPGSVSIVAGGVTYYVVVSGTSFTVRRSGSNAEEKVEGSAPTLTWNGGSRILLTFSNGLQTLGMLFDMALDVVAAPFEILQNTSYGLVASAAGGFMLVTQTNAAAIVGADGSVRPLALPFSRFQRLALVSNGSEYVELYQRERTPLDAPGQIIPVMVQRYTASGDAAGDAMAITNDDPFYLSMVWSGKEYVIVWSDPYGNGFLRTLDGAPQPLGKGDPWLATGPAGLFLLTSGYNKATTIRRLDTGGAEHVLSYGYVYQYVSAAATDGRETAVVWNEGTDIRVGRFALDGSCLDGAGVVLPIDHRSVIAPAIVFGGENYLVVWWNSDGKIEGVFFGRDGHLAGDPFVISDEKRMGANTTLGVTWSGTSYLVTWSSSAGGYGSGATVMPSGIVAPFKFANGVQMPSVAAGPRNLVVYMDYSESLWAKISGVYLDAAGVPFDIAREWQNPMVLEPRVATNGHDYLVTWLRQSFFRRSEAMVARLDDRGHLIGKPFAAAASETPNGARAIPLFDGSDYRVVVSGDPAMPLFTARVDDAAFACGCFGERTEIPIGFDLAATAPPVVAAASPEALVVAYGRPFAGDATYGSVPRAFLRIIRTPPPPRHRAAGR